MHVWALGLSCETPAAFGAPPLKPVSAATCRERWHVHLLWRSTMWEVGYLCASTNRERLSEAALSVLASRVSQLSGSGFYFARGSAASGIDDEGKCVRNVRSGAAHKSWNGFQTDPCCISTFQKHRAGLCRSRASTSEYSGWPDKWSRLADDRVPVAARAARDSLFQTSIQ